MQKTCTTCGSTFSITDDDLAFYAKISPVFNGKRYDIPPPTLCPQCRLQRRLTVRNERKLYHTKSFLSGKQIISMYAPDKNIRVLDQEEWWGDGWDALSYGRDFDFHRPFFEQIRDLQREVPRTSLYTKHVENSYYTNYTLNLKNCYLIFGGGNSEDCLFGKYITLGCKDVVDGLCLFSCEFCYEGVASQRCYNCRFFTHCSDCSDSLMIEDCQSCKSCMLCFGLRNAEYCFLNKPVGREEYERTVASLGELTSQKISLLYAKLAALKATLPHRASHITMSEDCTGDMVFSSKHCHHCFDIAGCEDCTFFMGAPNSADAQDCSYGAPDGVRSSYELCSCCGTEQSIASFLCWHCNNVAYSIECNSCRDLFGCCGLKRKQYCILNKQYSKEEYEMLVPKIIEHMRKDGNITAMKQSDLSTVASAKAEATGSWGEFFPIADSVFGYNETIAAEYFPMDQKSVSERGWSWFNATDVSERYLGAPYDVPQSIRDVPDDICNKVLACSVTKKPFKIVPQELVFYRRFGLPIPQKCPEQRHLERIARRNPYQLWKRKCGKCGKEIETTYNPDLPEIVYCEQCYLNTVH